MSSKQKHLLFVPLALFLLGSFLFGCGGLSGGNQSATLDALRLSVALTATADAGGEVSSEDALKTAEAKATELFLAAQATQTAQAALSAEEVAATATAFAPYAAELPNYGVDPSKGRPGWIHPPFTLDVEGYQQAASTNRFILTVAKDFVISADITWNTQYGTAGCGFIMRSDGKEEDGNQYMVAVSRSGLGHALFTIIVEGEIDSGWDFYARGEDPSFEWRNDTTNRIAVVGRGTVFSIYANGTLIGVVDVTKEPPRMRMPPTPEKPADTSNAAAMAQYEQEKEQYNEQVKHIQQNFNARMGSSEDVNKIFERGFVAMIAFSESGQTICRFDNAWLWLIEE